MFVHLRAHSYYSFLAGLSSPAGLAQAAARAGMAALALADEQNLTGAAEFYEACLAAGVRPLLGLELQDAPPLDLPATSQGAGSLVLLAMDRSGWAGLCRLSSAVAGAGALSAASGPGTPESGGLPGVLSFERLAQETTGLLCLSGGLRGLAARLLERGQEQAACGYLERLGELFPGRLYVELQLHAGRDEILASSLVRLAGRLRLPVVATHSIYYLTPEMAALNRLVTAMRLNVPLAGLSEEVCAPPAAYFLSGVEMAARFDRFPQAVAATQEVADRCRLELPLGQPHFPELRLSLGLTAQEALSQKATSGARRRYGQLTPQIESRLDHELATIGKYGYAPLFLIMEEIVRFARQKGIPISSRGSAASSLVAHSLGITSPDPLRLNLYFERFLNPARATPPDIDTDLCSRRRDEVIRFVYDRFGSDRVAMVCTINRFRRRSALREVAKAFGLSPTEIKVMIDSLPYRGWGPPGSQDGSLAPYAELAGRYNSPLHQEIFQSAAALLGLPRHLSIHPGGMVISPVPLTDLVPLQFAAKGVVITQFDLVSVERLGLVKIDLLGIRGLTVLGDVAGEMAQATGLHPTRFAPAQLRQLESGPEQGLSVSALSPLDLLDAIPDDDAATAALVRTGRTIGCFQIESPGMRATLKEIQAHSVDDVMVALALYRPGPLSGGLKDAFVRRHRGEEAVVQLHPALTSLLADTYGVILYQEQVLRIAHELAGLSLADADLLRRAMSHFDPGERMRTLQEKFIAGVQVRHGIPEAIGERIWELMAAFAGYGFPKAHAASYAQVAWRAAWCKVHYPAVFMAAVLANWGGYYRQSVYLTEARRLGLSIRPPHVNHAGREFSVSYFANEPVLFMGLDQVRDLTRRTQARIQRERPFRSLSDFLVRVDPRPVEAENLVRSGSLEGFGAIPSLLRQLYHGGWRGGQLPLFSLDAPAESHDEQIDWSLEEKVAAQEAILGAGVTAHRLELLASQIAAAGALTTVEAAAQVGRQVKVAGMRQSLRRSTSLRGDYLYLLALEDLDGMLDVIISAEVYQRSKKALSESGPYLIEGIMERDELSGEPFVRALSISPVAFG